MGITYQVGIDVGLKSVGLAAIETDDEGKPVRILNAQSVIHDGGVDPNQNKQALSRLQQSGVARRTRRMARERRRRLNDLDRLLTGLGYPIVDPESLVEPFEEWHVRAELASRYVEDDDRRLEDLSIAIRHMARHRGWRNPWQRTETLLSAVDHSPAYGELRSRVESLTGEPASEGSTVAQLVCLMLDHGFTEAPRLRSSTGSTSKPQREGLLPARMLQADNALELRRILDVQRVDADEARRILLAVFKQKSPRGSAERLVGVDVLDPTRKRASKASLAFQKYRIINVITNLRIRENESDRPLTVAEKQQVFNLLAGESERSWNDVAALLGVPRGRLRGVGSMTEDGEDRVGNRPPYLNSVAAVRNCSDRMLRTKINAWWDTADDEARESLIGFISGGLDISVVSEDPAYMDAIMFITGLSDDELAKLDAIRLPSGRAAYSTHTLRLLTDRMLDTDDDLHEARKNLFHVSDDWKPSADPIGRPVGSPAVDRVLKIVNRYILACENRWGAPTAVRIEHVRDGFTSVATARGDKREYERLLKSRTDYRQSLVRRLVSLMPASKIREADIRRLEALQRQNGECLYCGRPIGFDSCEMDHIVPRKGVGSTNTRVNLAAVCVDCNRSKGKTPFIMWAKTGPAVQRGVSLKDAMRRVNAFAFPTGTAPARQRAFKQAVILRLKQSEADPAIDNRSIESVAWMADELHRRIDWHFNHDGESKTIVQVFQGKVTAAARKASGLDRTIRLIGGHGKTRFDRRHHAVDAAVIALMEPGVAQTLMERESLRETQYCLGLQPGETPWQEYPTSTDTGYWAYIRWQSHMSSLVSLLNDALDGNRVKIQQNRRLSLGNSQAHDATIHPLLKIRLGDEMSAELIRRASTPQLYCALTRLPDYDKRAGLPANLERTIHVHGKTYKADDLIGFFDSPAAQIMVRGGSAEIGTTIHHARFYRWEDKGQPRYGMIRVFRTDLMRHGYESLFTVPLPPQSVSMRYGDRKTVEAVLSGKAEYVGYLTVGDVLDLTMTDHMTGQIGELLDFIQQLPNHPQTSHIQWSVDGFPESGRLKLRPLMMAGEGLEQVAAANNITIPDGAEKILQGRGWIVGVNTLSPRTPVCLRTNTFGEPRWTTMGMPRSWRVVNRNQSQA